MRGPFSGLITAGAGGVISVCITSACAQAPEASATAAASTLKTPWGEPDLQGIWTGHAHHVLRRFRSAACGKFRCPVPVCRSRCRPWILTAATAPRRNKS
jgi:hypothetical protein